MSPSHRPSARQAGPHYLCGSSRQLISADQQTRDVISGCAETTSAEDVRETNVFIQPIDYFLAVWFLIAFASTAYVAWDQFRNNPEPVVMKWGFILVTLYMGPLGWLIYVLADKEPRPGEHERFIAPL